jgi:N-acetylmuramoyl-L-alanine amidase
MTRGDDRFIELRDRVNIARKAGGDVMISIHADSNPNKTTRGFSVYTLSGDRAKAEAAKLATGNTIVESGGDGNATDGGVGESVSGTYNQGGMVDGLFGMNPPGPDDGAGYLDRGEYVIKKSSVNKYGRGLLDMINEGKVPAKKMKSLLG